MALESASYISQLNTANPASTDLIGQGDDHLRLIKSVLKTTFPNITGPVTADQDELNILTAAGGGGLVPVGAILNWYGSAVSVPTGWHICDGTTAIARSDGLGTIDVPDLRNLVIMGAGAVVAGAAFGAPTQSATTASAGAHTHATAGSGGHIHPGVTVAGHALTISEMPAHTHSITVKANSGTGAFIEDADSSGGSATTNTGSQGGGAAHTHDISWPATPDGTHSHDVSSEGAHTHGVTVSVYQPAMALHFIMKV